MRSLLHIKGFSIVELMVAIALGTLLVATIGEIYLSNNKTNTIQSELTRLQQNGRYANFIVTKDIRMAGNTGCANQSKLELVNLVSTQPNMVDFNQAIQGYDGSSGSFDPALPGYFTPTPLQGTDVLEIRMASSRATNLSTSMDEKTDPVPIFNRVNIIPGQIVLTTDCQVGDIFRTGAGSSATSLMHTTADNTKNNLTIAYLSDAQVMPFLYFAFYVKDTGRTNSNGESVNGLFRVDINGNEEEIAEGVDQMQVVYGVDTDGDDAADTYQTASQVDAANNWGKVISVEINLLFSTIENVNTKIQPYTYQGATVTPTDRKLRREWNSFITLRNRGLPS